MTASRARCASRVAASGWDLKQPRRESRIWRTRVWKRGLSIREREREGRCAVGIGGGGANEDARGGQGAGMEDMWVIVIDCGGVCRWE